MALVRVSARGQVLVPAGIRQRAGMLPGTYVLVVQTEGGVLLRGLSHDPVQGAMGMFARLGPGTPALLEDRRRECEQEEADLPPVGTPGDPAP